MTDRSLFPDEYPDREVKARGVATKACCGTLRAPPHVPERVWGFIHDMAHGRVPFTLDALVDLAGVSVAEARRAATAAQRARWVQSIEPDSNWPGPAGTYFVGRLRRKARGT